MEADRLRNVDKYDAKTYTRNRMNTRVVVKEKPFIRSRAQRVKDWLRPVTRTAHTAVDTSQLVKTMFCIIFPVIVVMVWRRKQEKLPDQWESQFHGLQHKQFVEENIETRSTDYFSITEDFQARRERALAKKRGDPATK